MKPITKLYSTLSTAALLTSLVFTPATFAQEPELPDSQKELFAQQQLVSTLKNRDFHPKQQSSFSALASVTTAVYANKVDYYHTHRYNFESAGGNFTVTENNVANIDYIIYKHETQEMVYPKADGSYDLPAGNYSLAVTNFGDGEIDYRFELEGNFAGQPDTTLPKLQVTSPSGNDVRLAKGTSTTFAVKGSTDAQYLGIDINSRVQEFENPGTFSKNVTLEKGLNGLYLYAAEASGNAVYADHYLTLPGVSRIAGKDRYEVSAGVSKQLNKWYYNTGTVVIARGDMYPDALSGGPLAAAEGAPVLLTATKSLPAAIQNQIVALGAERAIILGGTGSVSTNIEAQLKKLGVKDIERIGGKDRFVVSADTAERVADSYGSDTAIIASGMVFPDALSASTIAGTTGMPILLVKNDGITDPVQQFIKNHPEVTNYIVVGGPATVKDTVITKIKQLRKGAYVERIGGKDRFEVSANIVNQLSPNPAKAFLATGMSFADALTGSVLAAKQGAPLLLTHPTMIPDSVYNVIKNQNINVFVILGGTASVPNDTFLKLTGQVPSLPLEGKTIMLDPGHGGKDPGAVKNGYYEKNLNNQFTEKLASKLKAMGAKVLFTRQPGQDIFVDLPDRTAIANQSNADLFVSIHHDSNVSSTVSGLSAHYSSYRPAIETKDVYVLSNGVKYPFIREDTDRKVFIVKSGSGELALSYQGNNIAYDPTPSQQAKDSKILAGNFAKALVYPGIGISTIYTSTGIKDHNLFVTRWTKMKSVLVELGFISNPEQVKLLADPSVQDKRAQALANSIKNFYAN